MRAFLLLVLLAGFSGCAGEVSWDHCEPAVCGADCNFEEDRTCTPVTPEAVAGQSFSITAFLNGQGSYAGEYEFSIEDSPSFTGTVSPSSASVESDVLFEVDLELQLAGDAREGRHSITLVAEHSSGDSASTSLSVEVLGDN